MASADLRNPRAAFASVRRLGLVRAGLGVALMRVVGLALTLATSVVLARVLGPEGLGTYALAFAAISLLGLPVQMGLSSLVLRETAQSKSIEDWPRLRGMWIWATRRVLILSAVIVTLSVVSVYAMPNLISVSALPVFLMGTPLIALIALSQIRAAALRGLGRIVWGQLPDMLIRPGLLVVFVIATFWALGGRLTPMLVMGLHLAAAVVAFAVGVGLLLRARPAALIGPGVAQMHASDWNRAIWSLALIAGAQTITANADFLMLGWWETAEKVGLYKVATSGAALTITGLGVLAMITEPRFAAYYKTDQQQGLARLVAYTAALGFLAALPVMAIFYFFGTQILTLVFGAAYADGASAMVILTLGQTLSAFFGAGVGLLNMTGHEKYAMRGLFAATLINVALNFVLIPRFGIEGAALATLVSTVTWNVLLWHSVRRLLGLDSSVLGLWSWRRV